MRTLLLLLTAVFILNLSCHAQYNYMWMPDTLSGKNFNLTIKDTFAQIVNKGNQTITGGINGKFWGPTLFVNKGDEIQMKVTNKLNDSTTIHWHGMHLPAVMDGGPHQIIPPNTVWQPYWTVKNAASTYWYHPHLHEMAVDQITKGIGGLLIVRDKEERALLLPRTYGVDDIPVILTDRDFSTANQFKAVPYGDSILTNMTLRAQYNVPGQVVRFRILNAAIERSYNLGFSDNRSFYVITSDGGLLNAPVAVTKYILHAGERIEILVNFTDQNGSSIDLKAFNSQLANNVAGGENFLGGPFGNFLGKKDFNILHINIGEKTAQPITTIPSQLTTITLLKASDASVTRKVTISDSLASLIPGVTILGPNAFVINHQLFKFDKIDYQVKMGSTEIWEITSSSAFGHPFHIHDVQFNILSVNGAPPAPAQAGWKDVVFIPGRSGGGPGGGGTPSVIRFIAKFEDYADALHPFMFHCHIALHEDEGMMGQFVVVNTSSVVDKSNEKPSFVLYPNPAQNRLYTIIEDEDTAYYIKITDALGRTILMLPQPDLSKGINISNLTKGIYYLTLTGNKNKQSSSKTFVVE